MKDLIVELKIENMIYEIRDKKELYHLGTSINNAGTKTFAINKIKDMNVLETLISKTII